MNLVTSPPSSPPASPAPLSERARTRLARLAAGNGLVAGDIAILEADEKPYSLTGQIEVSPFCEEEAKTLASLGASKGSKTLPSFQALQEAVLGYKQAFIGTPDWIGLVEQEIEAHEQKGWGLIEAKIALPQKTAVFAATEVCPTCAGQRGLTCDQCRGQGIVICTQCQQQGRELCYYCNGRGEDPHNPHQPCHTCQGTRYAPCRFCQARGHLPCPTCHGQRYTTCPACKGAGGMTREVTVTCGARAFFTLKAAGLPSGLRRGLERIGIANLGKGHADVISRLPTKEELEDRPKDKRLLLRHYTATLPYAELRMGLGKRRAKIAVVGKRCALVDVPPFLEEPIRLWREKLRDAAAGKTAIENAFGARVIRDMLELVLAGKGRVPDIRRLYPFGFSAEALKGMLTDVTHALARATTRSRILMACLSVAGSFGLFHTLYGEGMRETLLAGVKPPLAFGADLGILLATVMVAWTGLSFITRLWLRRRFPDFTFALRQRTGKTGLWMVGAIIFIFVLSLSLAPVKPIWFAGLMRLVGK